jgi:adenylate cyclase
MAQNPEHNPAVDNIWRTYLTTGEADTERRKRRLFKILPGTPRCKNCYAPFGGAGSRVVKAIYSKRPSNMNPQLCNVCEQFARQYQGGAEIELSLLFADVRGSTTIAENMSPTEFGRLIDRFYKAASQVMIHSDALIDKIIGDQAAGMYVPGIAGPDHARRAIEAAQEMLRVTGHGAPDGPWIPLGIGVHTGIAYVGAVGSDEGSVDITVLGDAANTAARLSGSAAQGETLVSEAAYAASELRFDRPEHRSLTLKGKSEAVSAYVLKRE